MMTVTENQRQLAQSMIDVLPDKVSLIDVLTAGSIFLSNATIQSPYCTVSFKEAFHHIATVTNNLINGIPSDEPLDEEGGKR